MNLSGLTWETSLNTGRESENSLSNNTGVGGQRESEMVSTSPLVAACGYWVRSAYRRGPAVFLSLHSVLENSRKARAPKVAVHESHVSMFASAFK